MVSGLSQQIHRIIRESLMSTTVELKQSIVDMVKLLLEDKSLNVTDDRPLIGAGSLLDSMKLVELCLSLEDMASGLDFEFDWTSEGAMSRSRSIFRTVGTLAAEFINQMESKR
jgi:acyl carrier protein